MHIRSLCTYVILVIYIKFMYCIHKFMQKIKVTNILHANVACRQNVRNGNVEYGLSYT